MEGGNRPIRLAVAVSLLAAGMLAFSAGPSTSRASQRLEIPLGLDAYMPIPEDNRLTTEKVSLGRQLFFEGLLSRDGTISCATCHDPRRAFTDGRGVSVGALGRKGARNVPTLVNRGYGAAHFWDGRASSLEEQALQPIQNPNELDMTVEEVLVRLKRDRGYRNRFQAAFSREANAEDLARSLASYVRTILSGHSPVDRYLNGERNALSDQARQGLNLFRGKANCTACHLGPNFTDERFHNTGIAWRDGQWLDSGRFAVSGKAADHGAFKTPTLREIAQTAPYMHDGSLATLEEVIEFYDRGGNPNAYLDPELRPLRLTAEEKQALAAFLRALSGTIREGMWK